MKSITRVVVALLCFSGVAFASPENLVQTLSKTASVSDQDATKQIQNVFAAVEAELKAGRDVTIRNFGRFYLQEREARKGRNPKTGAEIAIPAKSYPRFTSSDKLKDVVNESPAKKG